MKAPGFIGSIRNCKVRRLYRLGFALLVVAVLLARVRSGIATNTRSDDLGNAMPQLDSFSDSAMAAALLKVEVVRLFNDYWNKAAQSADPAFLRPGRTVQDDSLARLRDLHRLVEQLDADLDHKLMSINNGSGAEFLDRFLDRLGVPAEDALLSSWAPYALAYGAQCQRSAEVVSALQNFILSHPELRTSTELARALQEWQATTNHRAEVPGP